MNNANQFDRLITIKEVMSISGISKSQIYALAHRQKFPKPYDLSESQTSRCSRWSFLEVCDWVNSKTKHKKAS